jgi:hypothetical protein
MYLRMSFFIRIFAPHNKDKTFSVNTIMNIAVVTIKGGRDFDPGDAL